MESGAGLHVSPHILVAGHATAVLRLAIELHMALRAVFFDFGMPLNQFAGRQNRLDVLRTNRRAQPEPQRQEAARDQPLQCEDGFWNAPP